ncbi:hypothetical protein BC835DRAFT_1235361, partial [Cytidiella melzeri]
FAAIIYAINNVRLAGDKNPIGFINPAVRFRSASHDITNGSNRGCGSAGFSAVEGRDPVTIVGTPDFSKLLKV